jgi:hypothetical protein
MVTPIVHSTNVLPSAHEHNGDRAVQSSTPPVLSLVKTTVAGDDAQGRAARLDRARPAPRSANAPHGMGVEVAA